MVQYVSILLLQSLPDITSKTTMTQTRGRSLWVRSVVRCTGEVRVGCRFGGDEGMWTLRRVAFRRWMDAED